MTDTKELEAAYALGGVDEVRRLYEDWAESYEESFASEKGYQLPEVVAEGYVSAGGTGTVLDVGAGTGLVGAALNARGVHPIHGTDLSAKMLDLANEKRCYELTFVADITKTLAIEDARYDGVVSAGTFTLGHLGPEPLAELIRIVRPGGLFAISVNLTHWEAAGFDAFFERMAAQIEDLELIPTRIYGAGATHDHADDRGYLVRFRVA